MNTIRPLTYQQIIDAIAALPPRVPFLQIYYTPFATSEETVARTWKERLFTLPWRPRQRDKLQTRPAIYLADIPPISLSVFSHHPTTTIIAHPAFKNAIEEAIKGQS